MFTPPSLGGLFSAVIKQRKFDIANGVDITSAGAARSELVVRVQHSRLGSPAVMRMLESKDHQQITVPVELWPMASFVTVL